MEIRYYIRVKSKRDYKLFKEKENLSMNINEFINRSLVQKDRENLEKTKSAAMLLLEEGIPLVPKFEEKIAKFCTHYNMGRGQVIASILANDVAAARFSKTASRQRTAEYAQIAYLQNVRHLKVKPLPSSGPNAIRLNCGDLIDGTLTRPVTATKTLDAIRGHDYLFLKYTNGSGGAQDNQAMDAALFLEAAVDYVEKHDDNIRFVAILDGDYYKKHWNVFEQFKSDRVLVETSDTYGKRRVIFTSSKKRNTKANER